MLARCEMFPSSSQNTHVEIMRLPSLLARNRIFLTAFIKLCWNALARPSKSRIARQKIIFVCN